MNQSTTSQTTSRIEYRINELLSADQFIAVLKASGLAERRPVDDEDCVAKMLQHANLTVTAWEVDAAGGERLVGVARSVTDFGYCCYLSDLAVDRALQKSGVGKALMHQTAQQLGPRCKLILLAAPAAVDYYPKVGFSRHPQAWILDAKDFDVLA